LRLFSSLILLIAGLFAAAQVVHGEARVNAASNEGQPSVQISNGWYQVRVQRRIIIRVPRQRRTPGRVDLGAKKTKEEKTGKCLWMNQLAGARPGDGKEQNLELVTKNGQMFRAYLGDGCLAREFYAGAYMEKSLDGKLCVDRDLVHARTGAKCEIDKFRRMVAK